MRKIILGAAVGAAVFVGATATASACTSSRSVDENGNRVSVRIGDCPGRSAPALTGRAWPDRSAFAPDEAWSERSAPAAVGADQAEPALQAAPERSVFAALADFFLGRKVAPAVPVPAARDHTARHGRHSEEAAQAPAQRQDMPSAAEPGVLCTVTVEGTGRLKRVGLLVAANTAIDGNMIATVRAQGGGNSARFTQDLQIKLPAGSETAIELARTNVATGAQLVGTLDIDGYNVPCLP